MSRTWIKWSLSFLTLLAMPAFASGQPDSSELVVKIRAGKSIFRSMPFSGSGIIFRSGRNNDEAFVLTSEHVVIHARNSYRHTIENRTFGQNTAQVAAVDWGVGLALLKVSLPKELVKTLPGREIFSQGAPERGASVKVAGFPHETTNLIETRGQIIDPQSARHAIPLLNSMIEVLGAHGEFGMSGGPVFSDAGDSVIGVLSHQYLEMTPGGRSRVHESRTGGTAQNHLLVISSDAANAFMTRYFSNRDGFRAAFVRDPDAQFAGKDAVISGELRFELIASQSSGEIGIGGGDVVGVGGGDVVGIGGASESSASPVVLVERSRNTKAFSSAWNIPGRQKWFRSMSGRLMKGGSVKLPYFIEKMSDSQSRRIGFNDLPRFVRLLTTQSLRLITFGERSSESAEQARIRKAGEALAALVMQIHANAPTDALAPALSLLDSLMVLSDAARSSDANELLDPEAIRALEQDAGWDLLFFLQFERTVELMKATVELRQIAQNQ